MRASFKDILMIHSRQVVSIIITVCIIIVGALFVESNIHFRSNVPVIVSNENHLSGILMGATYDDDGFGNILAVSVSTDKGTIPIDMINASLNMALSDFYLTTMNHLGYSIDIYYHMENYLNILDSVSFGEMK